MIPENYKWLYTLVLPRLVSEGLSHFGTKEIPGEKSNPEIISWAKKLGLGNLYKNDDTAWCGLFIAAIVQATDREPVENPLWAKNWAKWGIPGTPAPMLGDILVFNRDGGGGHVGLYIAEDNISFHVLGGNQANTVNITRIARHRMIACRRPEYKSQPVAVKRYELNPYGELSKNEA